MAYIRKCFNCIEHFCIEQFALSKKFRSEETPLAFRLHPDFWNFLPHGSFSLSRGLCFGDRLEWSVFLARSVPARAVFNNDTFFGDEHCRRG